MPTPTIPTGFKPIIQGYNVGAPDGVQLTEVMGGMPRVGMLWDRGRQPYQVTFILESDKYTVWEVFFHRVIGKGSIQFNMPMDSGFGLQQHLCMMVPDSYNASRAGGQVWSVTFTVVAESPMYGLTQDEIDFIFDYWELAGDEGSALLARIAKFANEDTLVLGTP
jgi:hypothetical protein